MVFDSVDWVWHHQFTAAASLLLIVMLMVATVWGAFGVARSARRADDQGESVFRVYGAAGLVMACAIGPWLHRERMMGNPDIFKVEGT